MNSTHKAFIRKTQTEANLLLSRMGELAQLNTLWAGAPNYDGLINQAALDTETVFTDAGLTTQVLADAQFALATIKGTIDNALPALTILSNLQ